MKNTPRHHKVPGIEYKSEFIQGCESPARGSAAPFLQQINLLYVNNTNSKSSLASFPSQKD